MNPLVSLRQHRPEDADAIYAAIIESGPLLRPWLPWYRDDYTRAESVDRVARRAAAFERDEEWSFVIVDARDQVLGCCGLHRLELMNGVGELGYWVRASAQRRQVATTAARLLCEWAFRETSLERIEILISVENVASLRVAAKVGATREATLRQRIVLHGRRHDCALFAVLKSEFPRRPTRERPSTFGSPSAWQW